MTIKALYGVRWTEYERGWGPRPDGTTFFRTEAEARDFVRSFWEKRNRQAAVPDEYENPSDPELFEVSDALHAVVMERGQTWFRANTSEQAKTWKP